MNCRWGTRLAGLLLALPILAGSGGATRAGADLGVGGRVAGATGETGTASVPRVYIEARGADETRILALRDDLVAAGAEKVNLFLPEMIIVCEVPQVLDLAALVDPSRYSTMLESRVAQSMAAGASVSGEIRFVRSCYERLDGMLAATSGEGVSVGFDDVLRTVSRDDIDRSRQKFGMQPGRSLAPGEVQARTIQQNSEFLAGNVVVRLVFPESGGHAEDWTPETRASAAAGAYAGAMAYQARFGNARLNFTLTAADDVPTSYEPIETTMGQHPLWIRELMSALGIPDDESEALMVHEYNNRGRGPGADWVFTAFIANSENDPNHRFADEYYTAYAYLGGPYLVIPYPAGENPYGIDVDLVFSTVFQHEMSHIFWALDEYPGPINGSDCRSRTGYLNYANMNKVEEIQPGEFVGCKGEPQPCIMWRAKEDLGRPVCTYTQGQIGVADDDGDSILDVYDAGPSVEFIPAAIETVMTPDIDVRFSAISNAVPNRNPMQDEDGRVSYAAPLKDAAVSINGSSPLYLTPEDGKWDGTREELSMIMHGLPVGMTEFRVTARNAFGKSSAAAIKRLYFPGIRFALFDVDPLPTGIRVSWNTVGETFGATLDLHRISNGGAAEDTTRIAADVRPKSQPGGTYRYYEVVDSDVVPGSKYRYFVKGYFDIVSADTLHYEVTSGSFDAQSMLPIPSGMLASHISPNPFNEKTQISVRIPEAGGKEAGAAPRSAAAASLQTPVNVTVYDVTGRTVKQLHNGDLFPGVRTFEWDGTNEGNVNVPSGVYFVKTTAGSAVDVKKVVVVR